MITKEIIENHKIYNEFEQKEFNNRLNYIRKYGFAVPTKQAIYELSKYSPIIEIGSGLGYWAYLAKKHHKADVLCVENERDYKKWWTENKYSSLDTKLFTTPVYDNYKVQLGMKENKNRSLFLSWPEYTSDFGYDVLMHYYGKYFIYVGEPWKGCCGTDKMFKHIDMQFDIIKVVHIPQWDAIHDTMVIYKRKDS
jgi:hypothetical protein